MIEEKLGVARSTMSYWFKDQPYMPNKRALARMKAGPQKIGQLRHLRRIEEVQAMMKLGAKELGILSERDIMLLGIGLYIGEGAKTSGRLRLSNSNPDVIRLGIAWLKKSCGITNKNLSVRLHIYPDNDPDECLAYWQNITGLDKSAFQRTTIDTRANKQALHRRSLPYGTAHVSVIAAGDPEKGTKLFRRVDGWMKAAVNQV